MQEVSRYTYLVLDDAHLLGSCNLERKVAQAVKHPEPVIRLDAPWDTDQDFFNYLNVLYDPQDELFRMWYSTMRYFGQDEDGPRKLACATSKDGIHWDRPVLNMIEVNGSKANNYILPEMGLFAWTAILDPSDIPQRRFKMLFVAEDAVQPGAARTGWSRFHVPLSLAYSHDGLHWERPQHVNPVLRGLSDAGWSFHYDADRRKYVVQSRRVPNLPRDISQYESDDLVNWEDKGRVLVPGDDHDPPDIFNFQSMASFRYGDYYLAALNAHYSLPGCESYESYYKPPADHPNRYGHVDIQLAFSRDGQRWHRPDDRSPLVPVGGPGDPDCGIIFTGYNPIVRPDGETWIYYTAVTWRHCYWDQREQYQRDKGVVRNQSCGMLAKVPPDRFLAFEAGNDEGSFTTRPWGPPHEVFVNADARGGSITCELITPYGEPVPGYTRSDCISVTDDGISQRVQWKNGGHPWDLAPSYRGGVLIRFHLKNAKLYSYSFTLPDPDGSLRRQKANARWCDHIKHRSDQWGKRNNEPAGGLPPHPDTTHGSAFE